jgi:hypothetical protein
MTSPLRTKRPITRRARTIWTRTAASLLAGWLALGVGNAEEGPPPILPASTKTAASVEQGEAGPPEARTSSMSAESQPVEHAIFTGKVGDHIQQTAQTAPARPVVRTEETYDFSVSTELPGPERIFRRQSENDFFQRIREETRLRPGTARVVFPESPPLSTEAFQRRNFPHLVRGVEPGYVCHGRLLFEQPNFERGGWDLGVLTPVANLGAYYYDLALLPYHLWTRPFEQTDCSAGKCLPGDPTPFYLYPEEFSVTGLVGEASVVTGLFFLFP